MEKTSLQDAKEMLQIFCRKYEIEGQFQENDTGGSLISPIWCQKIDRTCALGFTLDSSDCSLTFSLTVGRAKDSNAHSYVRVINNDEPGGFTAAIPSTGFFMFCKKIRYDSPNENFFMLLYNLLQLGLELMNSELFRLCAAITDPL